MLKRMDAIERPLPIKRHLNKKIKPSHDSSDDSEIECDTSPGGRPMKEYD